MQEQEDNELNPDDGNNLTPPNDNDDILDKFNVVKRFINPAKKKVKKTKRKIKKLILAIKTLAVILLLFIFVLSFNKIKEELIPSLQGQQEILIKETNMKVDCYEVITEDDQVFCVDQRDFFFYSPGETHYISEDEYGFPRLEVKKDEVRDFLR